MRAVVSLGPNDVSGVHIRKLAKAFALYRHPALMSRVVRFLKEVRILYKIKKKMIKKMVKMYWLAKAFALYRHPALMSRVVRFLKEVSLE